MRSTFSVLFYTKNQSLKDGKVPIMGRITINKTTACFSCKREVSLALWDAKAKRAKGKSDEARRLNQELDNIKAQITRHYQYVCDHDSLVTAKSVYNRYLGFGDDYHTLMGLFREQLASYKEKIGKEKAASTYRGLVADYEGATYDMGKDENVKAAKRDRAYLNGIAKEIDERRKAVSREYTKPLAAFEDRCKAVAGIAKQAADGIKEQQENRAVCAVCLPVEPRVWGINDSKKLTPARRELLSVKIAEVATAIGFCHIAPADIDEMGMTRAIRAAVAGAVADTGLEPDCVLMDGNPLGAVPHERDVVKGDAKIACIAAASIMAKVTRDEMMVEYDAEYPEYHLAESKGYASPEHIEAIRKHGLCPLHRVSFCGNFLQTERLF